MASTTPPKHLPPSLIEGSPANGAQPDRRSAGRDIGLDDLPETAASSLPDRNPHWLRVLLWHQNDPTAEVWVTCQAEQQPSGALWVRGATQPRPGDSGIRIVTDPLADPRASFQPSPQAKAVRIDASAAPSNDPPQRAGSAAPVIAIGPEVIGAFAAGGLGVLSGPGIGPLVDRVVRAGIEGVLRVLRTDAGLVRDLVTVVRARGAATEQVAMTPEQFGARHGFKRRAVYDFFNEGLPSQGEGKRRRVPVAEGDAWMSGKATSRIEKHAKQAAASHARQQIRAARSGQGMD
jgi:hypothetical protein